LAARTFEEYHGRIMTAIIVIASIIAFIAALLVFNLTGIFHHETGLYREPDLSRLIAPEVSPIAEARGNGKAVIFIHGFPSSPAHYRDLCSMAADSGYDAFAPLLPGHGTDPKDLHKTDFSHYYAFIRDYYVRLRPKYSSLHLVGSSMGGAYALKLAQEFPATSPFAPTSVSTIGTPLIFFSPLHGIWTYPPIILARTLGLFIPSLFGRHADFDRDGEDGDERWRGYLGAYPKQSYSLLLGLRGVRRGLRKITCPVYVFHARRDRISDYRNASIISSGVSSSLIRHWAANMDGYAHMRHDLLLYDSQRLRVMSELIAFFRECEGGKGQ
jgi:carboxylesterase